MPSWWPKSSSKDVRKKGGKESLIDSIQRKFKTSSDAKVTAKTGGSRRRDNDSTLDLSSQSLVISRSPSPSKNVSRCQSFNEIPIAQPLPLPGKQSGVNLTPPKSRLEKGSRSSIFPPLPRPACIRSCPNQTDLDRDVATASASSENSSDSDDHGCPSHLSPQATETDRPGQLIPTSPPSAISTDQCISTRPPNIMEIRSPANIVAGNNRISPTSSRRRPLGGHVPHLQVPYHGAFFSAPDSSMSSPSRSPMRGFSTEQVINSAFWAGKSYQEVSFVSSGHGSSPGSGYNSGHNSMGGEMSGQLFLQPSRGSPEYSPIPSPRLNSPGPGSRVHSGAVTPIHPRALVVTSDSQTCWQDDLKLQSHRLPLPPVITSCGSHFSHSNSPVASPSVPRSPGRSENSIIPESRWKKGKLLGRGTFGHVYEGFNSVSGEMCAMKEVTLFSDDAKSRDCEKQLMQEIALLSRLSHPNIVQYYGSESVGDRLYIYLEYVSGGSIHKILQEYGPLGELALRSYTHQILSGLSYLHSKNTVHRDIKGANILVDPCGRVKLADFGMAKHITGQTCTLSCNGSPYWMAPEVIKNSSGCSLAVDIWSLGCTVLEMATSKPPWYQYEGAAAMFKIGNSKDLPAIPNHLSDEGKDFVKQCLQRNPQQRPSASQLLDHPFVKNAAPLERPIQYPDLTDLSPISTNGGKAMGTNKGRNFSSADQERLVVHSSRFLKSGLASSDLIITRNISCPVSPIGSPILRPRSPQHINGIMSPSPISSPRTTSGSSTPLTGCSGAVPRNPLKQSLYLEENFGSIPFHVNGVYATIPSHHEPNHDIFRAKPVGSGRSEVPAEGDILAKNLARSARLAHYDEQSVLADRVSRQLLRDPVKVDLQRFSPLLNRRGGG